MRVLVGLLGTWLLWTVIRRGIAASPGRGSDWHDALEPLAPGPSPKGGEHQ